MYSTNFTEANKKFCLSLHYNGDYDSEIVPYPLCLGGLSKDISPTNTHKTGSVGYVYDFSVDY